ncbi:hypothetical protein ABW21_db0201833 [Orbilia brochopaga]|nr:hypothetical protein ABW21_db0201833 [Drechslerella brochopaga]
MANRKSSPRRDGTGGTEIRDALAQLDLQASEVSSSKSSKSSSASISPILNRLMSHNSRTTWPKWTTLRRAGPEATEGGVSTTFTLRIHPSIMDYTKASIGEETVAEKFANTASEFIALQKAASEMTPGSQGKLQEALIEQMTQAVFGSNTVEQVGLGHGETVKLCRMVFTADWSTDTPPRPADFHEQLEQLVQDTGAIEGLQHTDAGDRREVINHAGAMIYMITRVIDKNESFSEDLIRSTHKILVSGVDVLHSNGSVTSSNKYAGFYRRVHVAAGSSNFVHPAHVPRAMARFVEELNDTLYTAEILGEIDPFFIGAHAASEFVNVHPFLDGNGRTCRLLMNTILLKYAGIVAPIGELEGEREEYLGIARRRGEEECGSGELTTYTLGKASTALKRILERSRV